MEPGHARVPATNGGVDVSPVRSYNAPSTTVEGKDTPGGLGRLQDPQRAICTESQCWSTAGGRVQQRATPQGTSTRET